jgi:hypothetical protein
MVDEKAIEVAGQEQASSGPEKNAEVRQAVRDLRDNVEQKYWELGERMQEVYRGDMYRDWGFDSWKEYVDEELGFGMRKARYLVQLHEWFGTLPSSIQKWVRELGWTKARLLMGCVTKENAAEWRKRVEGKTVSQIEDMLKLDRQGDDENSDDGEGVAKKPEKAAKRSFMLFPEQDDMVKQALDKAKELAESDKDGHALTLICQEYLATNTNTFAKEDFLKNMERILGLKIVALKINENGEDDIIYGGDYMEDDEGEGPESSE